jgi:hypothetical protein
LEQEEDDMKRSRKMVKIGLEVLRDVRHHWVKAETTSRYRIDH